MNREGIKLPSKPKSAENKETHTPDYILNALVANANALKTFENFSPSNKKEYVEWITEAKSEITRDKPLETAIE